MLIPIGSLARIAEARYGIDYSAVAGLERNATKEP